MAASTNYTPHAVAAARAPNSQGPIISDAEIRRRLLPFRKSKPQASTSDLLDQAADIVLEAALPHSWRQIAKGKQPQRYFKGGTGPNFVHRVFVADMISNLQSIEGFRARLDLADSEERLASAIAEFEAAQLFARAGMKVRFTSDKDEPDLLVSHKGTDIAVEVKRRAGDDLHLPGKLARIVASAKSQLRRWPHKVVVVRQTLHTSSTPEKKQQTIAEADLLFKKPNWLSALILMDEQSIAEQSRHGMFGHTSFRVSRFAPVAIHDVLRDLNPSRTFLSRYWKPLYCRVLRPQEAEEYLMFLLESRTDWALGSGVIPQDLPCRLIVDRGNGLSGSSLDYRTQLMFRISTTVRFPAVDKLPMNGFDRSDGLISVASANDGIRVTVDVKNANWTNAAQSEKKHTFFLNIENGNFVPDFFPMHARVILGPEISSLISATIRYMAYHSVGIRMIANRIDLMDVFIRAYNPTTEHEIGDLAVFYPAVVFKVNFSNQI